MKQTVQIDTESLGEDRFVAFVLKFSQYSFGRKSERMAVGYPAKRLTEILFRFPKFRPLSVRIRIRISMLTYHC